MYTLLLEYPIRKFITTKILANNEYEEDQHFKAEAYLHKLMQVVPEFVASGRILSSEFINEGKQMLVHAEMDVPAVSEAEALHYLDRYQTEIPDTLLVTSVKFK
jgi:hypothetical protein